MSFLVIDHGLATSFAERLGRDEETFYFAPYADRSFPKHGPAMLGSGIEGVTRIEDFWRVIDDVETVVFPDVGFYQLQERLRAEGYNVWGAGLGEKLEVQRWRAKETMRDLGLPVGKCALVTGMTDLRKYIADNPKVYVKISGFRGLAETFYAENSQLVEPMLVELENELGGAKNVFPFILEHRVESVVEAGYDGFCIDGIFPKTCLTGVEVKDKAYLGAVRDDADLAEPVKTVNERLVPFFKEACYRQFFSTEIRVTEAGIPYLIDITARFPSPPSALYWEMIANIPDIIHAGARGELVEPEWNAKYGALAIIDSDFAADHWCPVEADDDAKRWIKFRNYCSIDGQGWIVHTDGIRMTEIGDCIGIGDTVEEAISACHENAKKVRGLMLTVHTDSVISALNEINKAEENDIIFTDDKVPDQADLLKNDSP